ncbi:MAG: GTPase ObgE [Candidatus Nomurabacteria bacterium]|jgi:GTP-binding protein|nr:GTPase ObgE [Candidatus Nomurabacteria bacterium]
MFVDTAKVYIEAGRGGNGAVSFRREIYINKGGPDGGNGGKGGDVVFVASKDCNTLISFRYQPELKAESGKGGSGQRSAGRSGKDLEVEVPIGTVVRRDGEVVADLVADGQREIVAHGGDGGFGNAHFKSSTRQAPRVAEVGEPGETFDAELELKLLADVGLVGFPNAGKSTFLSVVSNATPEIADYPFTTITPNLGVATVDETDILIADIPGLIEGASEGKGLGDRFLRHVERTTVLLHLIDVYVDDAGEAYRTIRKELAEYAPELVERPEIVALTKIEGLDKEIIHMQMAKILRVNPEAVVYAISAAAHLGVIELLRVLRERVSQAGVGKNPHSVLGENTLRARPSLRGAGAGVRLEVDDRRSSLPQFPLEHRADSSEGSGENSEVFSEGLTSGDSADMREIPVITLKRKRDEDRAFTVEKDGGVFVVRGKKIEKFARMTDYGSYDSLNRLRDIMKKEGIRGELTNKGALADSIISIAGHEFTFVEQ